MSTNIATIFATIISTYKAAICAPIETTNVTAIISTI
jgi:hypothetical protein